jgi:hypothetical protein
MLPNPRHASPWTLLSFDIRLPSFAVAELSNISMPGLITSTSGLRLGFLLAQEHEYEL